MTTTSRGTTACAANHGLAAALDYISHAIGFDAGVRFLAFIAVQFGPLTEGAVIREFLAAAFARSTHIEIGATP